MRKARRVKKTVQIRLKDGFLLPEPLKKLPSHVRKQIQAEYVTDDEDLPASGGGHPLLLNLLDKIDKGLECYVHDVFLYLKQDDIERQALRHRCENTLRISVVSPVILGRTEPKNEIIKWANENDVFGKVNDSILHDKLEEREILFASVADYTIQMMLNLEPLLMVRLCACIGDWYDYRRQCAPHTMRRDYNLALLKRILHEDTDIVADTCCTYPTITDEFAVNVAIICCHEFFFYLASSEYEKSNMLHDISVLNKSPKAMREKDRGKRCYESGSYLEALLHYKEAISASPYNYILFTNRAMVYLRLSEEDKANQQKLAYSAMCDAFRATKLNPCYVKGHYQYAKALEALNRSKEAVESLLSARRYIEALPKSAASSVVGDVKSLINYLEKIKSGSAVVAVPKSDLTETADGIPNASCVLPTPKISKPSKKANMTKTASLNTEATKCEKTILQSAERDNTPSVTQSSSPDNLQLDNHQVDEAHIVKTSKENAVKEAKAEYSNTLTSGSEALAEKKYQYAVTLYDKCFSILLQNSAPALEQTTDDVLLLTFARCVGRIYSSNNQELTRGIKELENLLKENPDNKISYLIIYYLLKAYIRQHRYKDAEAMVYECYSKISSDQSHTISWPGSNQTITNSDLAVLKVNLSSELMLCKYPPKPEYVCSAESCGSYGYYHNAIYKSSPDFNGFVSEFCTEKCVMYYHPPCWKKHKSHDKHNSKDIIDAPCPTPDCIGFIYKYVVYDDQAMKKDEKKSKKYPLKTEPSKSTVLKTKPLSERKIKKLLEKKKARKEKKLNTRFKAAENEEKESADATGSSKLDAQASPQADVRTGPFVVKQKRKDDDVGKTASHSSSRKHAKKSKPKQQFWNLFEDTGYSYSDPDRPFSTPEHLRYQVEQFEREYAMETQEFSLEQSVKLFYYEFLSGTGPFLSDSYELSSFIQDEPQIQALVAPYGTLADFLLTSPLFTKYGDYICIAEHQERAKQLTDFANGTISSLPSFIPSTFHAVYPLSPNAKPFTPSLPYLASLNRDQQDSGLEKLFDMYSSCSSLASGSSGIPTSSRSKHSSQCDNSIKIEYLKFDDTEQSDSHYQDNSSVKSADDPNELPIDGNVRCSSAPSNSSYILPSSVYHVPATGPSHISSVNQVFPSITSTSNSTETFKIPPLYSQFGPTMTSGITQLAAPVMPSREFSFSKQSSQEIGQIEKETQTEISREDKSTSTDYEKKDDYDQLQEKCQTLQQQKIDYEDNFVKLKRLHAAELRKKDDDLKTSIECKDNAEKELEKLKKKHEKDSRKWTDEKRSIAEKVNAAKEADGKLEKKDSEIKSLNEELRRLRLECQTANTRLSGVAKASDQFKERALLAELEVLNMIEDAYVKELDNLISCAFLHQQRMDVYLTPIQREQVNSLRSRLKEIKNNFCIKYRTQKEGIMAGITTLDTARRIPAPDIQQLREAYAKVFNSMPAPRGTSIGAISTTPQAFNINRNAGSLGLNQLHNYVDPVAAQETPRVGSPRQLPNLQQDSASSRKAVMEKQLVTEVLEVYPQKTEGEVLNYLHVLRERKQKLTGMRLKDLKQLILDLISRDLEK